MIEYLWWVGEARMDHAVRNVDGSVDGSSSFTLDDLPEDGMGDAPVPSKTASNPRVSLKCLDGGRSPAAIAERLRLADGLEEPVAFLDQQWMILAINHAWRKSARAGTVCDLEAGDDYLQFCAHRAKAGDKDAAAIIEALPKIAGGLISRFERLDCGDRGLLGRIYRTRISTVGAGAIPFAILARYDVTELNKLKRQRSRLAGRLLHAEEDERRRVARDLHDSTAQDLVALQLSLGRLKRSRRAGSPAQFADVDETLARLQREIRSLSYLLYPPEMEKQQFSSALEMMVRGFGQRTSLGVSLFLDEIRIADRKPRTALYRLAQEALANIHRHAQASEVEVRLIATDRRVHLMIKDNGKGIAAGEMAQVNVGVGLASMRHRIEELGGWFAVRTGESGTAIIASLPLAEE